MGRGYYDAALADLREVQYVLARAGLNGPPLVVTSATLWGRLDESPIESEMDSGASGWTAWVLNL